MIPDSQIFIVVDIEADGPAVGLHSMLSLAAVATTENQEVSQFYRKLTPLPDAHPDPATSAWWSEHPEAHAEATSDPRAPEEVMTEFCQWIAALGREAVFVANPVGFDYTFVSWYLARFAPSNPFKNEKNGIRALDLTSFVAGKYGAAFEKAARAHWPDEVTKGMPMHTHNALDDAKGYAVALRNLIAT